MFCIKCGFNNDDTSKFCTNCSASLENSKLPEETDTPLQAFESQHKSELQSPVTAAAPSYTSAPAQHAYYSSPQYPPYQPPYGYTAVPTGNEHVSVGMWILVFFLSYIPLLGIIMLFVWAFGGTPKKSLKSYARAQLILILIAAILSIIGAILFFVLGAAFFNSKVEIYRYSINLFQVKV